MSPSRLVLTSGQDLLHTEEAGYKTENIKMIIALGDDLGKATSFVPGVCWSDICGVRTQKTFNARCDR